VVYSILLLLYLWSEDDELVVTDAPSEGVINHLVETGTPIQESVRIDLAFLKAIKVEKEDCGFR